MAYRGSVIMIGPTEFAAVNVRNRSRAAFGEINEASPPRFVGNHMGSFCRLPRRGSNRLAVSAAMTPRSVRVDRGGPGFPTTSAHALFDRRHARSRSQAEGPQSAAPG